MEREKMIERIARVICENGAVDCFCPEPERGACTAYNKARDILNELIPEGAVVLTGEEVETTEKIPQKIKDFYKWFIEIEKEQARKETAREILKNFMNYVVLYGCVTRSDLLESAGKYGVEVE